jgi:homoaconitase/3-isopropylmalate dehydratase large subunit
MPQTLSEKILSEKVGHPVKAGELVLSPIDWIYAHDLSGPTELSPHPASQNTIPKTKNNSKKAFRYNGFFIPPSRLRFFDLIL